MWDKVHLPIVSTNCLQQGRHPVENSINREVNRVHVPFDNRFLSLAHMQHKLAERFTGCNKLNLEVKIYFTLSCSQTEK